MNERLNNFIPKGKAMILAYDQGLEHGPRDFLKNRESINPLHIINIAREANFTGLVLHAGIADKYNDEIHRANVSLILKLNGKSELYTNDDPYSPQLYSVDDAIALGAKAVGYTVYTGSKYEYLMNKEFTAIIREAHKKNLPVIGWMYPRGNSIDKMESTSSTMAIAKKERENNSRAADETTAIVSYAARVGLELGADIVKVKYTGSVESFSQVVASAAPTKVVMSGGAITNTDDDFLSMVSNIMQAGATGIAVGRNVWQRENAVSFSKKIYQVIFGT